MSCPITLTKLSELSVPIFWYLTLSGKKVGYDAGALAAYLVSSGDFRDPTTREVYTDKHLAEMDTLVPGAGVLSSKNNPDIYVAKRKAHDDFDYKLQCLTYDFDCFHSLITSNNFPFEAKLALLMNCTTSVLVSRALEVHDIEVVWMLEDLTSRIPPESMLASRSANYNACIEMYSEWLRHTQAFIRAGL